MLKVNAIGRGRQRLRGAAGRCVNPTRAAEREAGAVRYMLRLDGMGGVRHRVSLRRTSKSASRATVTRGRLSEALAHTR